MQKLSRRQMAIYAADQLSSGVASVNVAKNLAAVLVATKRVGQFDQLIQDVAYELETRGLAASANVTSATPLNAELKNEISKFIAGATKTQKVSIEENVDESVIGGVLIETATRSWDQTLKRRLKDIREAF